MVWFPFEILGEGQVQLLSLTARLHSKFNNPTGDRTADQMQTKELLYDFSTRYLASSIFLKKDYIF